MGEERAGTGEDALIYEWPSLTTLLVAAHVVSGIVFRRRLLTRTDRAILFPALGVAGFVLSITTMGSPALNVYGLGFSPWAALVLAVAAALIARRAPAVALLALAVILACDIHLYRSRNLFDYAIDPWIVLVAWGWMVVAGVRWVRRHLGD